ncbi:MAG: PD40 domain-containing protein [Anaerolineales bacterium]|nr:PD40 domain-containing protein [Anaerolineales bacterium]
MNPLTIKQKNILFGATLALFAIIPGACGDTAEIDLGGAAGLGTEEAQSTIPTDTPPEIPPATATPIPAASGHIIFTSDRDGQNDLYMVTPDGGETTRLTAGASVDESGTPQLSPDGTRVAFAATIGNNTDIYVVDIASNAISRITDAQGRDSSPSWSPDGGRIVFESFRDGNLEIYTVNADGSNPTRLTNDSVGDSNPLWSPTTNEILFSSSRFGNSDLFLLSPNGSPSTLTTNPGPDNNPAWSPDGSAIAYLEFSGELSNICLIGRDGLNKRCLNEYPSDFDTPTWSPDGNWIASTEGASIHIFNIRDGQDIVISQAGIEPHGIPAWSPDGLRLAFQAFANGNMELFQVLVRTNEFMQVTSLPGVDGKPVWIAR